jgi:uncharacterized membrane protein YeaQ/YmgE (transglycosylase-associated protein family)
MGLLILVIRGNIPIAAVAAKHCGGHVAMSFITTIIVGLVVGVLAKFIAPFKNEPSGLIMTALVGIGGSLVGTYLGQFLGLYAPGETAGWIFSIVGAIILLGIYAVLARSKNQA